MNTKFLKNKK